MLFFAATYITTFILAMTRHSFAPISFLTFSNAVFVILILPKIIGFWVVGNSIFLTLYGVMDDNAAYAAAYITFIFMIAINTGYIIARPARLAQPQPVLRAFTPRQDSLARMINLYIVLPISLVAILIYFSATGVSLDALISKRDWGTEGAGLLAYVSQKAAQFAKVGFFVSVLGILASNGVSRRWQMQLVAFSLLLVLVFLSSSQRAGVFLLVIMFILILHVVGRLKIRHIVITLVLFLLANSAILASRFVDGFEGLNFFEIFIRRYFFELEKISAIFEYSVSDGMYLFSPISGIFSVSTAEIPDMNIHYFIGSKMFGLPNLGIPPSVLGEIILFWGPIYVFPVTLLIALALARLERALVETRSINVKLILVVFLANSYFLLLNSDSLSLLRRLIFDGGFMLMALFIVYIAKTGGGFVLRAGPVNEKK